MKTKLLNLVSSRKGKMPSAFSQTEKEGYLPYIDIKLFDKGILSRYAKADKKATLVNKQDVLVVWDGARFGLSALGWEGVLGSTIVALQSDYLISKFLYYFLQLNFETIQAKPRGVGIPHVEPDVFWNLQIPVPPMAEQKRIVRKIEELFGVLDRDIQRLTDTLEQLFQFRQSVLHQAFSGNIIIKKVIDVGSIITGSTPSTTHPEYYGNEYPFYKPTDLNQGYNTNKAISYISKKGFSISRKLPEKSILVTCIGATIGKTGLIRQKGICNQQINAIIPSKKYLSEFVYFYAISPKFQNEIKSNASATTLPILNKKSFEQLPFPYMSLPEQQKIVDEIEKAFRSADKVQKAVQNALEEAKKLKQSILKKAFAGELVPQDPNDKPVNLPVLKGQTK